MKTLDEIISDKILEIIHDILSKFIDFINYKSLLIFIIFIYFQFINKNYILSDYNIYLYLIIYITMFIVLIYKRAIKFRIVLLFILISSFSYLIKGNIDNNIFILLFSSIYLISDFKSTPNSAFIQYIYGGTLGLISLFLPVDYLFIFVVIISIIFKILDRYYIYYLAK